MGLGVPEMMLYGALAGGGVNLLRGKGLGGILQGAALGGAAGGLGGLAGNAIKGAEVAGAGAAAGGAGGVGGSLGAGAVPTTASAFESSMGLAGLPGAGTIESAGLGTIGAGGTLYNPEYFANVLGNPVYTGGGGLLSQIGTGAGSIFDTAKANLPDYVTPQNVLGAANIISGIQPPQRQAAPAGGVRQGQTSGLNVDMGGARPIGMRRREDF
jgi:hypothetical protein